MLRCRMTMSSKRVMQRPEMFVDRQLLAGMMAHDGVFIEALPAQTSSGLYND